MPTRVRQSSTEEGGLHLSIENEDWIAIRDTSAQLEQLGKMIIEFANCQHHAFANLDSPSSLFRAGSLGISLYRTPEPG